MRPALLERLADGNGDGIMLPIPTVRKIYADAELAEEATIRKFRIVQSESDRQVNERSCTTICK